MERSPTTNDPLARAMWDFYQGEEKAWLNVITDISLPEPMMASYFFRAYEDMNDMEQIAMNRCKGSILDIGAGAGCHSSYLHERGHSVTSLEASKRMTDLLKAKGLPDVVHSIWQEFTPSKEFDHILLLMNGLGMAEKLESLSDMLETLASWLKKGGEILLDSSDLSHLYELEDGSKMTDLNGSKEGEIVYTVSYKGESTSFPWLFVSKYVLAEICKAIGLEMTVLCEIEESYLASIKVL